MHAELRPRSQSQPSAIGKAPRSLNFGDGVNAGRGASGTHDRRKRSSNSEMGLP